MTRGGATGGDRNPTVFEEMSAFRKTFGELPHKATSPEYYRWKTEANPFGRGVVHLVQKTGAIAGSASVTFKNVLVRGSATRGVEIGDTYTNPDFRRQGIFSTAVRYCTDYALENGASFIYGTPNDASLPGYEQKLNYQQVPGARVATMTKHIGAAAVAKRLARRFRMGALSSIAAHAYLAAISFRTAILRGRKGAIRVDVALECPDTDGSWAPSRSEYTFFTYRDRAYLEWRFRQNPDDYQILVARDEDRLMGYLVTKVFDRGSERVGAICDFVTSSDDRSTFFALVADAERRFRAEDVEFSEVWCASPSLYFGWLGQMGYVQRTSIPIIVYTASPAAEALLDPTGAWHFTRADSDNI